MESFITNMISFATIMTKNIEFFQAQVSGKGNSTASPLSLPASTLFVYIPVNNVWTILMPGSSYKIFKSESVSSASSGTSTRSIAARMNYGTMQIELKHIADPYFSSTTTYSYTLDYFVIY